MCALTVLLMASCAKQEKVPEEDVTIPGEVVSKTPVKVGETGIVLPAGSRISVSGDGYTIEAALPEGYAYLAAPPDTPGNQPTLAAMAAEEGDKATYKCACSGSNACKVFYQEEAGGFGCLHSSCRGDCTGSFTKKEAQVSGVISLRDNELNAKAGEVYSHASLTPGATERFLSLPDVQSKIGEQYRLLYRELPVPDFEKLENDAATQEQYMYVKAHLYGVRFYLVVPTSLAAAMPGIDLAKSSASCSCGSSGGGSCVKKGANFLGFKTYWCEGTCNGCELTVSSN